MIAEPKFYVHTEQVRGEPRIWIVADRSEWRRKFVSKTFFKEKPCRALCDQMNADWERYNKVMISKPCDAE